MNAPIPATPYRYFPRAPRREADYVIAGACADAWYRERGGSRIQIPIGALAALALWPIKGPDAWLQASFWLSLDEDQLATTLRECWARWWIQRPDLIHRAAPLHDWLHDDTIRTAAMPAVKAVIRTAITEGILELVSSGDDWSRTDTDVLGWMVTLMRSGGERRMLAEFPTPPDMAALMTRFLLAEHAEDIEPGQSFNDPTSGTGAMVRAMALHLHDRGHSPADFGWAMTDLDALSAAVAACCAILWNLGPRVLVWCGDTLSEGDGPERAAAERAQLIGARNRTWRELSALSALTRLTGPDPAPATSTATSAAEPSDSSTHTKEYTS
ncbi:hypothetical protein [Streptacidiphilus jiangxiensis]|uniref:N-6 DNA Methylase n=1 Tax=Streptacidiphilus jiangxiensis TaxID=235985 RepID=A0A1H8BM97_STRJI|nr:hypothetical protein [Streptacidiphilus jiangxiensis]SEM83264.1 hypothetical protein SAMN05414137_1694 [Streptacidiphilus jiangxiensis]